MYTIYSILFIVFVILIIVTAFITVALTYFQLAVEDHRQGLTFTLNPKSYTNQASVLARAGCSVRQEQGHVQQDGSSLQAPTPCCGR